MKRSIFYFVILLLVMCILPAGVFSQTSLVSGEWITTGLPNVADPPHAPDAIRKAYLKSDPQKPYQMVVFEQADSAVNGQIYSYLSYYKVFPSMMRMATRAVIEAKSLSQLPSDIGIHLSVSYINSKTGGGSFWGSKVISNQWTTYTWDTNLNVPDLDQFDIFSIDIDMGPNSKRMTSQVGVYTIHLYDKNNILIWNYNLIVGVEQLAIPTGYSLNQNYPNPFNPTTKIKFSIPESGNYKLVIYNSIGQEVSVLINEFLSLGIHEATFDARGLSSGVYVYRLIGKNIVLTKKMVLLK